ncbi:MAG: FkbM family methyltransferase [Candidatus Kerfeldbacteria bacterium]|nr:FkbM family methyltransferase [Candidatus Kerfeldbacteria bacterium]
MIPQYLYNLLKPIVGRQASKRNALFQFLRNAFGKIFIPASNQVNGFLMNLQKSGHSFELAFEGMYEPQETNFLNTLDLEGKIVFDVGACMGYYSLLLSKKVGHAGMVYSFEPEQENFQLLEKNIRDNNLSNVTAYRAAVGNTEQPVFVKRGKTPGQHTVYSISQNFKSNEEVPMVRLDDFIKREKIDPQKIGYVKIDVEGLELDVLLGMKETVTKGARVIVQCEYAPQHLREHNCNFQSLVDFIKQYKLNVYYWDFSVDSLLYINDPSWLLIDEVVTEFTNGAHYCRNLILTSTPLSSEMAAKELLCEVSDAQVAPSNRILIEDKTDLGLKLPSSGKYFVELMRDLPIAGKIVLDIGTGYFGYLANHAKLFGAARVVAVDVNEEAIVVVKKYYQSPGVEYRHGDVYSALYPDEKFDVLFSNPPQLPRGACTKVHDVAGPDGMAVIDKILSGFSQHAQRNGTLYLLVFDFIFSAVAAACHDRGLNYKVQAYYNKKIRTGGETEKAMSLIKQLYDGYSFKKEHGSYVHKVLFLAITNT